MCILLNLLSQTSLKDHLSLSVTRQFVAQRDCLVGDEGDLATEISHLICSHENICDTL